MIQVEMSGPKKRKNLQDWYENDDEPIDKDYDDDEWYDFEEYDESIDYDDSYDRYL